MDVSPYLAHDWWKKVVLAMVRDTMQREKGSFGDWADNEELYDNLLLALYPSDWGDNERAWWKGDFDRP